MTFFIYDPSKIFDPSTYLFYKANSLGDLLNFSMVATVAVLMYLKKKNPEVDLSKIAILIFSAIFMMGLFCYNTENEITEQGGETLEGLQIPKFRNYNEVLSID